MPSGICASLRDRKSGTSRFAFGHRAADQIEALGPVLDADHVADANLVAGNIDALAVDRDVAVADHLPGLGAALAEAEPMHDVVQPALEQRHAARRPCCPCPSTASWKYLRNCRSSTP